MKAKFSQIIFLLCSIIISKGFSQNTWNAKPNYGGTPQAGTVGFAIGNFGYIGGGGNSIQDFWAYDKINNSWTQLANLGGGFRTDGISFSVGGKGYIGLGTDAINSVSQAIWEYDPIGNSWAQKTNFPGPSRNYGVGFSIGNKGYVGTGFDGSIMKQDFWEYNPVNDSWTSRLDFPGGARISAIGFSIGNNGYLGAGTNTSSVRTKDIWQFNPVTNTWSSIADFPHLIDQASAFTIGSRGYICTGTISIGATAELWVYDTIQNAWIQKASLPTLGRYKAIGFAIGNKGYVGTGYLNGNATNDFWEYTPDSGFVGINYLRKEINLTVFPNPAKNKISLSYSIVDYAEVVIEIYNLSGQKIKTIFTGMQLGGKQNLSFDLSNFDSSVYYLKLSVDGVCDWVKILKE